MRDFPTRVGECPRRHLTHLFVFIGANGFGECFHDARHVARVAQTPGSHSAHFGIGIALQDLEQERDLRRVYALSVFQSHEVETFRERLLRFTYGYRADPPDRLAECTRLAVRSRSLGG